MLHCAGIFEGCHSQYGIDINILKYNDIQGMSHQSFLLCMAVNCSPARPRPDGKRLSETKEFAEL